MGFFDELKKLTRPYDDDDDEFIDESVTAPPAAEPARRGNPFSAGYGAEQPASAGQTGARAARQPREGRVVSINGGAGHQNRLVLVKPERFDTAAEIADHLREGHSIVMNLETTPNEDSRRLIDFLSGVTYALDGKIQKAALKTYVIVPKNADLSGNVDGNLETGGMYF